MKEYRQNSHTLSLLFWALLCTATAIVLFVHSHRIVSRVLKLEEILGGIALLMFGPAALVVYLIRARMVWVSIDPGRGLVVSGRLIPWAEVRDVRRRRPSLRRTSGPTEISPMNGAVLDPGTGCVDPGCATGIGEFFLGVLVLIAAVFAVWVIAFVLFPLIVIPVLEVFAPFGDRITLITRRGRIVLRDLRDADEFIRLVSAQRPVRSDS